ncbi:MAG: UDP-N-acetylglucosamine 3-dehydrogenase [Gammaproteobacteria bacterium]|nr:MAG: UDP-N-acetylglucosamine 3-dehydrogenase [Gammaproteobacteria bacterium]
MTVRTAVIGAGYLGRFHAQKYAALPGVELVGVVDIDPARAAAVAEEVGSRAYTDPEAVLDRVDAVSVVTPTVTHAEVAATCLDRGVHVLLEKPMTTTLAEADRLIELAERRGLVLQIGHLERFNPAVQAVAGALDRPLFIESTRLAPFKPRATDVDVVLDLMIHDIDLILALVGGEIEHIEAAGARVLSEHIDIANARLHFRGGCVANVTASRVSLKSERRMRIFQPGACLVVDGLNHTLAVHRKEGGDGSGAPRIASEERRFEASDPLYAELAAFVAAVREGRPPAVGGADGRRALDAALRIRAALGTGPAA